MSKKEKILIGAGLGAIVGGLIGAAADPRLFHDVLVAAAKPAPRKTVVIKQRRRTFWDSLFWDPDVIVI